MLPCLEDIENNLCVDRSLEETKDYIGSPDLIIYYNEQRFDTFEFNHDKKIVKESKIKNQ